jgi:hypothetical protein
MHLNSTHYLLAGLYHPLSTADLSLKMSTVFEAEFKIRMSLEHFRQWMAFLISCNRTIFEAVASGPTATAVQFGHSEQTDTEHYGADLRYPDGLSLNIYYDIAHASAATQSGGRLAERYCSSQQINYRG